MPDQEPTILPQDDPESGGRSSYGRKKRSTDSIGTIGHGAYVSDDREFGFDQEGLHIPTGNSEILLTRRQLLYGAIGVAGIATAGGIASAVSNSSGNTDATESLEVAIDEVFTLEDCVETPYEDAFTLYGEYSLPYGSLIWAGCDTMAACLLPTETAKPLAMAALLNLSSGYYGTILESADGQAEGFEIYDLRASEEGVIWAEANILSGHWRVFLSTIYQMGLEEHHLMDEGDASTEMPTLAAIGDTAFWQVMPVAPEDDDAAQDEDKPFETQIKMSSFRTPEAKTILTVEGRCATAMMPANNEKGVVITPSDPEAPSHRQLVVIGTDGEIKDAMTLPRRMTPMEACYGSTGFAFSFENIYNYGEGIANLGTYTPQEKPSDGAYSHRSWFRFPRTPSIPPSWCDDWFMMKSTSAVVGIHLKDKRYIILPSDNNAEVYGDCLASMGSNGTVVTYTNIDRTEAVQDNEEITEYDKQCLVRVWTTV